MNNVWQGHGGDTTSRAWQDRVDTNANTKMMKRHQSTFVSEMLFVHTLTLLNYSLICVKSVSVPSADLVQTTTAATPFLCGVCRDENTFCCDICSWLGMRRNLVRSNRWPKFFAVLWKHRFGIRKFDLAVMVVYHLNNLKHCSTLFVV